jgi:TonB family protein
MLGPVLDALSYLHQRNLVHGRLKPSNIMAVDEVLKLSVDCVRHATDSARPSLSGDPCDAPENASGVTSPAADIWALGALVIEAVTQKPPAWAPVWDGSESAEPLVPASLPPPFSRMARECLRISPAHRPTLSDLRAQLEPAQPTHRPALSDLRAHLEPAQPAEPRRPGTRVRPSRSLSLILAGAVLVVVAVIAGIRIGSHPNRPPAAAQPSDPAPAIPKPSSRVHGARQLSGTVGNPVVLQQVLPNVPQPALDTIQGHVTATILVHVDTDGHVSDAAIDAQGPSRYFANFALDAARNWKFRPPKVTGRAVASTWILEFRFEPSGPTATSRQTSP